LQVLGKIMSIKTKSQERQISAGENNPAALGDEENQGNSVSTNNEERQSISTDGDHTETEEISDQEREEQEAFLSLAQVICDKLDSADLDGAIQIAVQNENNAGSEEQRREAFVEKLKTVIDDNRHATADCLRIVKLCGQIAKSVMLCEQYVEIFRNKGFKSSLSEASKTMSELESCMLFAGTDFGLRKTVKPLFLKLRRLGQRCSQQLVTGKPFALFLAPSQDTSVSLVVTCINVCMCFALFHFSLFLWNIYIGVLFSH